MNMKMKTEDKCLCDQCPRRFICFTQKRVFSDPAYQAMYEAFCEEGLEHKQAVKAVKQFIENEERKKRLPPWQPIVNEDWYKPRQKPGWYKKAFKWEDVSTMDLNEAKQILGEIKNWTKTEIRWKDR